MTSPSTNCGKAASPLTKGIGADDAEKLQFSGSKATGNHRSGDREAYECSQVASKESVSRITEEIHN